MAGDFSHIVQKLNEPFGLLDAHRNRWIFVFLCCLYGSIFVVVYNPLGIEQYHINSPLGRMLPIQFAGIVGGITLILTQFVFRPVFGFEKLTYLRFLMWSVFELLMISIVLYIFYGERGRPFWSELLTTTEKTFLLGTVPFAIAILTIGFIYKRRVLPSLITNKTVIPSLVSIKDEQGKAVLSIRSADILCLKTEDNYVSLTFLNNGKIQRKLIRNNLKNLEEDLYNYSIRRVHRSCMINTAQVISIERKSGKTEIKLVHLGDEVFKVSSTYKSNVDMLLETQKTEINPTV